jgi:hypothetical protein
MSGMRMVWMVWNKGWTWVWVMVWVWPMSRRLDTHVQTYPDVWNVWKILKFWKKYTSILTPSEASPPLLRASADILEDILGYFALLQHHSDEK